MKRKSLMFKFRKLAEVGCLRSYSRASAIDYYSQFSNDHLREVNDAYDRGLILCSFEAYPETESKVDFVKVCQFSKSLADFVLNVGYYTIIV